MPSVTQSGTRSSFRLLLPWASLAVVWVVWGSTFLGIRVAVQSMPPLLMTGSRYVIAGALLCAIVWLAQGRRPVRITWPELRTVLITAVLLLVIGNGLLSISEVRLQSGTAALLVATVPLWMIVLNAILSRSIGAFSIAGVVLGSLGVVALAGAPSAHESPGSVAMVLVGSFSWAAGSVYARRRSPHQISPFLVGVEMLAAGVMMCAIGTATGEISHVHAVPIAAVAGWLWLIFAGAMLAYSAYSYAVRTLPTNIVATYAYVNPVVAVILGTLFLKEPFTLNLAFGGVAIVLSVVAIVAGNRRQTRSSGELRQAA